jgi:hypothetical protein
VKPTVSMRKALSDPQLLGNALKGESWKPWRTLLIAENSEKLTDDERALFSTLTNREHEPLQRVDEFAAVVGSQRRQEPRHVGARRLHRRALRPRRCPGAG